MKKSNWIDWEIQYSLKEITRNENKSLNNDIVGVIMKHNGGYEWFKNTERKDDGCITSTYKEELVYDIISENRFNLKKPQYACNHCKSFDQLNGSYISYVEEEEFLNDCRRYIENAYEKSRNPELYKIRKEI